MTVRFVLIGLLTCSSIGFAQAPDPCATAPQTCATLIETHATSEMRIPNTVVDVYVGVSVSGKDLAETQKQLSEQTNKLVAYLKVQQVERLITTHVSFTPDTKDQKSGPEKTVGYNGGAKVSFRAKADRIGSLVAGILSSGANQIMSTAFTATEEEIAVAQRKLSEDATRAAIEQANGIAKSAGMKVVAIRKIGIDDANHPVSYGSFQYLMPGVQEDSRLGGQGVPIEVAPGDQVLSLRVDVTAAATR